MKDETSKEYVGSEIDLEYAKKYRENVPEEQRKAAMKRMQGYPELDQEEGTEE